MHEEELLNRIAVTWHNRTRQRQLRTLLDSFDSVTEALARHPELANREALQHAKQELNFIEKHNITTYFYRDDSYPYRLAQCVDAPLMLYAKGNLQVNPKHAVSIVGTRQPSERGKDWCRRLVLDLAAQIPDLTIISGLAYGIDVIAHKAAILLPDSTASTPPPIAMWLSSRSAKAAYSPNTPAAPNLNDTTSWLATALWQVWQTPWLW